MQDLKGKVVLITGAAGAIGGALAAAFAAEGAKLVLTDLKPDALQSARDRLGNVDALALPGDLTREPDIASLADAAFARFGQVDVLINNAAVSVYAPIWETPIDLLDWMWDVNVKGIVHVLRQFTPRMLASGREGHIVNIASMAGMIGQASMAGYCASKHAVVGLTESLRDDLKAAGAPIGVTLVAPGATKTSGMADMKARVLQQPDQALAQRMAATIDALDVMVQNGIEPTYVAASILNAVKKNLFWVICPPTSARAAAARVAMIESDLAAAGAG